MSRSLLSLLYKGSIKTTSKTKKLLKATKETFIMITYIVKNLLNIKGSTIVLTQIKEIYSKFNRDRS